MCGCKSWPVAFVDLSLFENGRGGKVERKQLRVRTSRTYHSTLICKHEKWLGGEKWRLKEIGKSWRAFWNSKICINIIWDFNCVCILSTGQGISFLSKKFDDLSKRQVQKEDMWLQPFKSFSNFPILLITQTIKMWFTM